MRLAALAAMLASGYLSGGDSEEYEAKPGLISPGGYVIFVNTRGPLSYETMTPGEIPEGSLDAGAVQCSSCQNALSFPISLPTGPSRGSSVSGAYGNGSLQKALQDLQEKRPEIKGVYDVKVDYHRISVLGIYRRLCSEVTARAFR